MIPTVHMGTAASYMEKNGIRTNIGNLNLDIREANRYIVVDERHEAIIDRIGRP